MTLTKTRILFALLLSSLGACGGGSSYEASDIADQTPRGEIDGSAWALVTPDGRINSDGELDIVLYSEEVAACGFATSSDAPSAFFRVPAVVGEYPLKFEFAADDQTVTFFVPPSNNIIGTQGLIVVESVTETQATVALIVEASDSQINGRFTVDLCAE